MDEKDGGPAFPKDGQLVKDPNTLAVQYEGVQNGMTLRDYFAGQALAGGSRLGGLDLENVHHVAKNCYALADAMLKARSSHENHG